LECALKRTDSKLTVAGPKTEGEKRKKNKTLWLRKKNVNGRFAGERGTTGLAWFSSSMLL